MITEQEISGLLENGLTPAEVCATLGLAPAVHLGTLDGIPAVIAIGWEVWDTDTYSLQIDAETAQDAAEEWAVGYDREDDDPDETAFIGVNVARLALAIDDGEIISGHADDTEQYVTVALPPDEPDCERSSGHDWVAPHELVGGLRDNPGVFWKGGGVIINEVCRHCGAYRVTDTWTSDPNTGREGLTSVRYKEPDEASLRWLG